MEKDIIDTGTFGYQIREARTKAGYATAEDFAKAITEQTGVPVSKQTIYNIESGKQEPRLTLYLAMLRLLNPDSTLPVDDILLRALPARWRIPLSIAQQIDAHNAADSGYAHAGSRVEEAEADRSSDREDTNIADTGSATTIRGDVHGENAGKDIACRKAAPDGVPTIDGTASIYGSLSQIMLKSLNTEAVRHLQRTTAEAFTRILKENGAGQSPQGTSQAISDAVMKNTVFNQSVARIADTMTEALNSAQAQAETDSSIDATVDDAADD